MSAATPNPCPEPTLREKLLDRAGRALDKADVLRHLYWKNGNKLHQRQYRAYSKAALRLFTAA